MPPPGCLGVGRIVAPELPGAIPPAITASIPLAPGPAGGRKTPGGGGGIPTPGICIPPGGPRGPVD